MTLLTRLQSQHPPRNKHAAAQHATRAFAGRWLLIFLVWIVGLTPLVAQEDNETEEGREYQIKAVYLYQFGRYVDWPANAFPDPKSPFVIGVPEQNPLIPNLDQISRLKKIHDRPIQILQFSSTADIPPCNILYLPASLTPETQAEVIRKTSKQGVLLVGDHKDFLEWGGIMRFVVEDNKIRVAISRKAAERAGLLISAKLLQVARVVD
jgi:hypothetical protein